MRRPSENEYAPYYSAYMKKVKDNDVIRVLEEQLEETTNLVSSIPEEKGLYSYAEGKWSVKQVLGHIIDVERLMSYRAMSIARNEKQRLPGMEQDDFVNAADFNNRSISSFLDEYVNLRKANIALFKSLTEDVKERRGVASNFEVTVLALMFIIAGHEKHHLDLLRERYLINK